MADLNVLPKNWQKKAIACPESVAERYRGQGRGRVWVDDDCPAQFSIVVVDEKGGVFRLTDPADTLLILQALKWPGALVGFYSQYNLPQIWPGI